MLEYTATPPPPPTPHPLPFLGVNWKKAFKAQTVFKSLLLNWKKNLFGCDCKLDFNKDILCSLLLVNLKKKHVLKKEFKYILFRRLPFL